MKKESMKVKKEKKGPVPVKDKNGIKIRRIGPTKSKYKFAPKIKQKVPKAYENLYSALIAL